MSDNVHKEPLARELLVVLTCYILMRAQISHFPFDLLRLG